MLQHTPLLMTPGRQPLPLKQLNKSLPPENIANISYNSYNEIEMNESESMTRLIVV